MIPIIYLYPYLAHWKPAINPKIHKPRPSSSGKTLEIIHNSTVQPDSNRYMKISFQKNVFFYFISTENSIESHYIQQHNTSRNHLSFIILSVKLFCRFKHVYDSKLKCAREEIVYGHNMTTINTNRFTSQWSSVIAYFSLSFSILIFQYFRGMKLLKFFSVQIGLCSYNDSVFSRVDWLLQIWSQPAIRRIWTYSQWRLLTTSPFTRIPWHKCIFCCRLRKNFSNMLNSIFAY